MQNRTDQGPTALQTFIFSKSRYPNRDDVIRWLREHNNKFGNIAETENSWRARQRSPSDFEEGRFRIIDIAPGIRGVVGRQKV